MQITTISFLSGIYQRIIALLLTVLSFFTTAKPDNVKLTVLAVADNTLTVEYKNETGKTIGSERKFIIEKKTYDGFEPLEFKKDAVFPDLYEELLPGKKGTLRINILEYYSCPLETGTYRIVFFYSCSGEQCASADFSVE